MPMKMPPTIDTYFAATNKHDVNGMIAVFADGAVVKDEGRDHHGSDAIRKWMKDTLAKYDFKVETTGVTARDGKVVVTGLVSGNFPGSPVSLRYEFTLDHEKITRLEIG